MFCPKCSQQQISEEVRFCSRCGFQLAAVAKLLTTDGVANDLQLQTEENLSLYQQITSRGGAKMVFVSLALIPFIFMLAAWLSQPLLLLVPFTLFITGLYIAIFNKSKSPPKQPMRTGNLNASEQPLNTLPLSSNMPVPLLEIQRRETAEMNPPSSVTDPTTKLLDLNAKTPESKV